MGWASYWTSFLVFYYSLNHDSNICFSLSNICIDFLFICSDSSPINDLLIDLLFACLLIFSAKAQHFPFYIGLHHWMQKPGNAERCVWMLGIAALNPMRSYLPWGILCSSLMRLATQHRAHLSYMPECRLKPQVVASLSCWIATLLKTVEFLDLLLLPRE